MLTRMDACHSVRCMLAPPFFLQVFRMLEQRSVRCSRGPRRTTSSLSGRCAMLLTSSASLWRLPFWVIPSHRF